MKFVACINLEVEMKLNIYNNHIKYYFLVPNLFCWDDHIT